MSEQVNLQEALVKKAAFGNDIDLEKFDDNNEQHVQSTAELSAAGKERLEHVGIDLERENRSASFIQVDNAPIEAEVKPQLPLELMNTGAAAKKYPELVKKYWWNAVKADTDKYTAKTALEQEQGYFIRVKAGQKIEAPLQACVFIGHEEQLQRVHNIVIVEEGAELNIISGCASDPGVEKGVHIGISEYEISALLQYYAISAGAAQMSFETIVGTGERSALPHGRPTGRKIRAHEPILMDFGIQYKNYQSDMTRVCFIGKPQPKIASIYHIVLEAQLAGIRAIKQGAVAKQVDNAARSVITREGYGDYFTHGLGHGLGIGNGCEYPILNETGSVILQEGMMMSCEPGIYLPGIGGIRIEDDVVIRNGIGTVMNKTSKELLILKEDAAHEV